MNSNDRSSDSLSNEDFVKDVDRLLSETPIPPMNQSASGTFARAVDVPPILLCESNTVYFYEEVLYGQQSVDSLVNSRITHLLERFLYMRPERICNAYMSYVRQKNEDTPQFDVSPRCLLFAGNKFDINTPYSFHFTITNRSTTTQTITIEPVPSVQDVNIDLTLSETVVTLKRGRSVDLSMQIAFTKRSIQLSKLILFSSEDTRDFINISATSQQKVFGVDSSLLPMALDYSFSVPGVLVALKQKLFALGGLREEGIFRLSGSTGEVEQLIDYLDDHGDKIRSEQDIPSDQVNVVASVIKAYYRDLPMPILNGVDRNEIQKCNDLTECYNVLSLLQQKPRELLMWVLSLFADVAQHCDENKMNSSNLARVLAPNLFSEEDDLRYATVLSSVITFCDTMISHLANSGKQMNSVCSVCWTNRRYPLLCALKTEWQSHEIVLTPIHVKAHEEDSKAIVASAVQSGCVYAKEAAGRSICEN
ncbi:hypothetical protein WA588_005294 [Blastocystis sp. NMH]